MREMILRIMNVDDDKLMFGILMILINIHSRMKFLIYHVTRNFVSITHTKKKWISNSTSVTQTKLISKELHFSSNVMISHRPKPGPPCTMEHLELINNKAISNPNASSLNFSIETPSLLNHEITFIGKRGYFFFPPEIRNQITSLILVPGEIYLRPRPIVGCSVSKFHRKRYGCQFLATCRQAYEEGHELYYSSNTFNLPSGRHHWCGMLFQLMQPKHQSMIQYLGINCSIYDIHYHGSIHEIGKAADQRLMDYVNLNNLHGVDCSITSTDLIPAYCPAAIENLLRLWVRKITYVSLNFPGLKKLRVTFMEVNDPWLIQYFGLPQDQKQIDKLSALQGLRQGEVRDLYHPVRTVELSREDLALASDQINANYLRLSQELPIARAVQEATRKAYDVLRYEFAQIGREEEGQRYQEFILIMKSSWVTDRLSGKWPYWISGTKRIWGLQVD